MSSLCGRVGPFHKCIGIPTITSIFLLAKIGLTQTLYFFFATLTMMISFHTLMKYIITIIPEVSYLISFLQFYYTYFTGLLFLLSRIRIRNIQKETTKIIFSLYKNEGALYDFWFSCNIITITTGMIWAFLKHNANSKSKDALVVIIISSVLRFSVMSAHQIKQYTFKRNWLPNAKYVSNVPITKFLQMDSTCMLVIAELFLESKQGISKVALLVLHSILSLLGVFDFEMTKRVLPYQHVYLFVFGLLENWILVLFWYECRNSKAILYTLCYLLKWNGNTASQSVNLIITMVLKITKNDDTATKMESDRIASFGFDCFSIISDLH